MRKLKTYLSMVAIAGMLFATSCVDDKESEGVSKLREAKTKQLEAEAALSTAQADAAKIVAESQKILTEAEAAYQKALADQVNARTDADKQIAVQELKRITKETDLALLKLENQLAEEELRSQAALIDLQRQLEALNSEEHPALTQAIADYKTYLAEVNAAKTAIANLKIDFVRNQATLAGSVANEEETRDAIVRQIELNKAKEEGKLTNLEKSLVSWKALETDVTQLEATIKAKKAEYETLIAQRNVAYNDYQTKYALMTKANEERDYFELTIFRLGALRSLYFPDAPALSWKTFTPANRYYSLEEMNILAAELDVKLAKAQQELADSTASLEVAKTKIQPLYDELQDAIAAYNTAEEALTAAQVALQAQIDAGKVPGDPEYDAALANVTTKTSERDVALTKRNDAQKPYNAILATVDRLENDVFGVLANIFNNLERDVASAQSVIAEFKGDSDRLVKLNDAYVAAIGVSNAAGQAFSKIYAECNALSAEIAALDQIWINSEMYDIENGGGTTGNPQSVTMQQIKDQIVVVEDAITDSQNKIKQYDRDIVEANADTAKAIALLEQAIEDLKADIADEEAKLKFAETRAAAAKKVIDQYTE